MNVLENETQGFEIIYFVGTVDHTSFNALSSFIKCLFLVITLHQEEHNDQQMKWQ